MKKTTLIECQRCGNQQHEPRASKYPEDLFLENWHDLMEAQAEIKALQKELTRLHHRLERERTESQFWMEQSDFWSAQAQTLCNLLVDATPQKRRSKFDEPETVT